MTPTITPAATARRSRPDHRWERRLIAAATVLMGLIAGFFYAYACSVMIGLAQADDRTFVDAMQSINATVRNVWFAPSFFGALIVTVVALAVAHLRRSRARWWVTAAAALYLAAFLITMGISVPLNDELAAAGPPAAIADLAGVRQAYEGPWVQWNVLRTVLSTLAFGALIGAALSTPRNQNPR